MALSLGHDAESVLHEQSTHTYISHDGSRLQMLSETRKFIKASPNGQSIERFHERLREVANLVNVQRIILYKIQGSMAEVILALGDTSDTTLVTELVDIHSNPNLFKAVQTRQASNIPVEGIGIDAAFPIGKSSIILGVDTTDTARTFTREEIILLEYAAESIIYSYDAGKLIHQLGLDPLTGLWNRRALDGEIDHGKNIFNAPSPRIQGVAYFDIDYFKTVNDTHGHSVGDQVLKRISNILSASMKAIGGSAFRYGGEEFVGLLYDEGDYHRVNMIRQAIEQDCYEVESIKVQVTISVGLALRSTLEQENTPLPATLYPGKRQEQVLARCADQALYHAKKTGRNRVVQWPFSDYASQV